jgi:HlyD family secretion protein
MKRLLWILIPVLALVGLVIWRFGTKKEAAGQMQQQMGQRRGMAASVELGTAEPKVLIEKLSSVGTVESPFRVQISPKTSGRIEFLQVREGDRVSVGQTLVKIDPSELQAAVFQQQALVAQARSRLAEAQLGRGPTEVGVASQIAQQRAAVTSAQADYNQVRRNYDAQVASVQADAEGAAARVRSAEAQVRNARAELGRSQASLKNAQARLTRTENLYRQGFIAAQDVDDARTAVDVAKGAVDVAEGQVSAASSAVQSAEAAERAANQQLSIAKRKGQADVEASRARVTQAQAALRVAMANRVQNPAFNQNVAALRSAVHAAEAQLRQARARLADTVLKSPIVGTVTARTADPGSLASPGTGVLTVQYLEWLYVTTSLPIDRAAVVREGQTANIEFDALPKRVFTGKVTNINPAADIENRQFGIKVKLANPGHVLKPGMFGRVSFVLNRVDAPVTVPREAVKMTPEGATVTVVDKEMVAHVMPVVVGPQDESRVQIVSGVKAGDKVVVLSYQPVRDGAKVRPPGARGEGGRGGGDGRQGGSREGRPSGGSGEGRRPRGGGQ